MFSDRNEAGRLLAKWLMSYKGTDAVVYAIPRGGVLVGLAVSEILGLPLELVFCRKIGHPLHKEYAICAVTEEGYLVCNELGMCGIDKDWIEVESDIQRNKAKNKRDMYKTNQSVISPKGKVAIIVDDGIATGLTMKAAVHSIKNLEPSKIVVASPVAQLDSVFELEQMVDEVVVEDRVSYMVSVSKHYQSFPEVLDEEVMMSIDSRQKIH